MIGQTGVEALERRYSSTAEDNVLILRHSHPRSIATIPISFWWNIANNVGPS